eukprot:Selendium_serpulae@DN3982_c0_g1_i2.p1
MWLTKEFGNELKHQSSGGHSQGVTLLDVGCGVGNATFPFLYSFGVASPPRPDLTTTEGSEEEDQKKLFSEDVNLSVIAFDCSRRAISLFNQRLVEELGAQLKECSFSEANRESSNYDPRRTDNAHSEAIKQMDAGADQDGEKASKSQRYLIKEEHYVETSVLDITNEDIPKHVCPLGGANVALLLFVLSAIPCEMHSTVINRIWSTLRPGGAILFRDYAKYDMAELRFSKSKTASRIANEEDDVPLSTCHTYVRQDGTLSHFFTKEDLHKLFCSSGLFEEIQNEYRLREITNRKTNLVMHRIWLQAIFRRV